MKRIIKFIIIRLERIGDVFRYVPRSCVLAYRANGYKAVIWFFLLMIQGLFPVGLVLLSKRFVNSFLAIINQQNENRSYHEIVWVLIAIISIALISEITGRVLAWLQEAQSLATTDYINKLLHQHSSNLDLAFYDSPNFYDSLWRAQSQSSGRIQALVSGVASIFQNLVTFISMTIILTMYGFWIPIVLVVSAMPTLYVVLKYSIIERRWRVRITPDERKGWYYDIKLKSPFFAQEVRFFNLGMYFGEAYQAIRAKLRNEKLDISKRSNMEQFFTSLFAMIVMGVLMVWMLYRVVADRITVGDLVLIYSALNQGQGFMRSLFSQLGNMYANSAYVKFLFEFLALKSRLKSPEKPKEIPREVREGLEVKKVSFRYTGAERDIFKDCELFVPKGKIVALVGNNGAGKSSLIKLMCRLYDPAEGCIALDGTDIREFSIQEYRKMVTVIFQDPAKYYTSVKENIAYGRFDLPIDIEKVKAAAREADADEFIEKLSEGYETQLGKFFKGGIELSIGQWQRIALARAFYRDAPVILLDEPTSAMDSWAENEWYRRFQRLAKERTVVLVTHRLTTAMKADIIYVMKDGELIESGSHDELLEKRGYYASSWTEQMKGAIK